MLLVDDDEPEIAGTAGTAPSARRRRPRASPSATPRQVARRRALARRRNASCAGAAPKRALEALEPLRARARSPAAAPAPAARRAAPRRWPRNRPRSCPTPVTPSSSVTREAARRPRRAAAAAASRLRAASAGPRRVAVGLAARRRGQHRLAAASRPRASRAAPPVADPRLARDRRRRARRRRRRAAPARARAPASAAARRARSAAAGAAAPSARPAAGGGGSSASGTLIAMRSTAPGRRQRVVGDPVDEAARDARASAARRDAAMTRLQLGVGHRGVARAVPHDADDDPRAERHDARSRPARALRRRTA